MIAPVDSTPRVRNVAVVHSVVEDGATAANVAEKALSTVKSWIVENPTAAVATCAGLGLLIGYLVKRR